jgi:hypothetical protein
MKSAMSKLSMLPSSLVNDSTSKIEPLDLVMVRPSAAPPAAARPWRLQLVLHLHLRGVRLVPVANTR